MNTMDANIAASFFKEVIKAGREHGIVRIVPLINVDSIIASSILFKYLIHNDVNAVISLKPPESVEEPTIFIDIRPYIRSQKAVHIVYNGSTNGIAVSGNIIETSSSISSLIASILDEYWGVGSYEKILCLVGGIYRGKDLSHEGFVGIESRISEELLKTNSIMVDSAGLRLWGWKRLPLAKALAYTIIPYLPGLTGNMKMAMEIIGEMGISEPEKIHTMDIACNQDLLGSVAKEIYSRSFTRVKRRRNPLELLSKIYYITMGGDIISLNEIFGAIYTALALGGDILYNLFYIAMEPSRLEQIMILYEKYIDEVSRDIARSINEAYEDKRGRLIIEPCVVRRPEAFEIVLRDIGALGRKLVVLRHSGAKPCMSLSNMINVNKGIDPRVINEEQLIVIEAHMP